MPECYFGIYLSFLVELLPEIDDSDMLDLWIRQAVAETVVLQGDQLSLLTQLWRQRIKKCNMSFIYCN